MNDSAFEAFMIGVNTLIFMVALAAGIKLMSSINDMVEYTRQTTAITSGGSLIETYGDIDERTFSGAQVYSLYGQYVSGELEEDIVIKVAITGATYNIDVFAKRYGLSYLNKTFILKSNENNVFLFELKKN